MKISRRSVIITSLFLHGLVMILQINGITANRDPNKKPSGTTPSSDANKRSSRTTPSSHQNTRSSETTPTPRPDQKTRPSGITTPSDKRPSGITPSSDKRPSGITPSSDANKRPSRITPSSDKNTRPSPGQTTKPSRPTPPGDQPTKPSPNVPQPKHLVPYDIVEVKKEIRLQEDDKDREFNLGDLLKVTRNSSVSDSDAAPFKAAVSIVGMPDESIVQFIKINNQLLPGKDCCIMTERNIKLKIVLKPNGHGTTQIKAVVASLQDRPDPIGFKNLPDIHATNLKWDGATCPLADLQRGMDCHISKRPPVIIKINVKAMSDRPTFSTRLNVLFPPIPNKPDNDNAYKLGVAVGMILRSKPHVMKELLENRPKKAKIERLRDIFANDKPMEELIGLLDDKATASSKPPTAQDYDGDELGIAVHCASLQIVHSQIGHWRIKKENERVWSDPVSLIAKRLCSHGKMCTVILNPKDRLKFELKDNKAKNLVGKAVNLLFRVRKVSDGRQTGSACISLPSNKDPDRNISISRANLQVRQLGCTGLMDISKYDKCGVCEGGNKCLGCDGQPNSGAKISVCLGICYGGTTNRTDPLVESDNCKKFCNENFKDNSCRVYCSPKFPGPKPEDCNNECLGDALYNECDVCYGGTTGLTFNSGKDKCGVCGGDNSKCTDCAGVLNGPSKKDRCGNCLDTKSPTFDKCNKINQVQPNVLEASTISHLDVRGIAISLNAATCTLKNSNNKFPLGGAIDQSLNHDSQSRHFKFVMLVPKTVTPGKYQLQCDFKPGSVSVEYKSVIVMGSTITGAIPSSVLLDTPTNVMIEGTQFTNTSQLHCLLRSKKRGTTIPEMRQEAEFISSSKIKCILKGKSWPEVDDICLRFSDSSVPKCTKFTIKGPAPTPQSCWITRSLTSFCIKFDNPFTFTPNTKCSDIFTNDTKDSVIGDISRKKCRSNKNILCVPVGKGMTLKRAISITMQLKKIQNSKRKFSDYGIAATKQLQCTPPKNHKVIKIAITGSTTLEQGFIFKFRVRVSGSSRPLYKGEMSLEPGVAATPEITEDLRKINSFLNKPRRQAVIVIGSRHIPVNTTYQLKVVVQDAFTGQSAQISLSLTRKRRVSEIPDFKIIWKIKKNRILLNVPTTNINGSLSLIWSASHPTKRIRYIKESSKLAAFIKDFPTGTITVKVTAYMNGDSKVVSTSIYIASKKLKLKIKGGNRVIGKKDALDLKGDLSDPDREDLPTTYMWSCFRVKRYPCFYHNGSISAFPKRRNIKVSMSDFSTGDNEALTFELIVIKGNRSSKSSVNITITAGEPPLCKLTTPKDPVDISKKVKLQGHVVSRSIKTRFYFSVVNAEEEGYDSIDIDKEGFAETALGSTIEKKGRRKKVPLVIKPNKLSQNSAYKFRLTCIDTENDATSHAEAVLKTISRSVKAGDVYIEPAEGESLNTTFTVGADGDWDAEDETAEEGQETITDEEEDESPPTYNFGIFQEKGGKRIKEPLVTSSQASFCQLQLPEGLKKNNYNVEVYVERCTSDGSCSDSSTIHPTVKPGENKAEKLKEKSKELEKASETGDIVSFRKTAKAILLDENSELAELKSEINRKILTQEISEMKATNREADKADKMEPVSIVAKIVKSVPKDDGNLPKNELLRAVKDLAESLAEEKSEESESKRKRRAVSEPVPVVTEKTPSEVEKTLEPHNSLITADDYSQESMTHKKNFLDLISLLGRSMCKGLVNGEEARVAQLTNVVVRTVQDSFEQVDVNYLLTGCEQCSTYGRKSAQVLLGQTLKEAYGDWNCDSEDDGCNGACMVSSQVAYDALLNSSYSSITRSTDIIHVQLFNPSTFQTISVSGLAKPVNYKIFIPAGIDMDQADLRCHRWDSGLNNWTTSGITTLSKNKTERVVTCTSNQLGFITIFDMNGGIEMIVVTVAPPTTVSSTSQSTASTNIGSQSTTSSPTSSVEETTSASSGSGESTGGSALETTTSPSDGSVSSEPTTQLPTNMKKHVKFSLDANYTQHVKDETVFKASITKQIALKLGISESRITDLNIEEGSILVTFTLLPGNDNEPRVQTLTDMLKTIVEAGELNITTPDGKTLNAITTSFMILEPTSKPVDDSDKGGLKQEVLIGIIAGVCLVVLVVVGVAVYFRVKSKRKVKGYDDEDTKPPQKSPHRSIEGISNEVLEENAKSPVDISGINSSLPGSPIYDNVH